MAFHSTGQRRKEGVVRRKLGRNPRIPFSSSQIAFLEAKFLQTPYLSSSDVTQLAGYLKLTETRVCLLFYEIQRFKRLQIIQKLYFNIYCSITKSCGHVIY